MITLSLEKSFTTAVDPSQRVCQVAAMFGLGVDPERTIQVVPPIQLTLAPGRLIFITGASGGGKSTLLHLIAEQLRDDPRAHLLDFNQLSAAGGMGRPRSAGDCPCSSPSVHGQVAQAPPAHATRSDLPLVESLGGSLEQAVRWLSLAGLNDAFVMLRRPCELSDGQRYRWKLACAIREVEESRAEAQRRGEEQNQNAANANTNESLCTSASPREILPVILADEFGSTLDRLTAAVIARNLRKWTSRSGVCFIAATTHDDLLESLDPDVLLVQHPGAAMEVCEKSEIRSPKSEFGV